MAAPSSGSLDGRTRQATSQRHEQIVAAAARLFADRGFSGVGIDDIGAELGISGPALYRHISGKDSLLAEIVVRLVDDVAAASAATLADGGSAARDLIAAAVQTCLDRHAEVTVTLRSVWHVQGEFSGEVLTHWSEVGRLWRGPLQADFGHLDPADLGLYVRACAGLVISAGRRQPVLPRPRLVELVTGMICAMLATELTAPAGTGAAGTGRAGTGSPAGKAAAPAPAWTRSSRKEQILDAAIALFRDRGFRGVSLREIGDAVGTSASAAYRHFASKEDILATAITRVGQRLTAGMSDALAGAASAEEALDRLLSSYIAICVQNHELIAVATSEAHYLSPEQLREHAQNQRLFRQEWTHCLAAARPELTPADVRVRVQAVAGLITEATRSRRLERRVHLEEDLFRLSRAALYAS